MNLSAWFSTQLKTSGDGFVWAVEQVPVERWYAIPPAPLGEWVPARHVFHMVIYEHDIVLPHMRYWLGEPLPLRDELEQRFLAEDKEWENQRVEDQLAAFQQGRTEQIALLPSILDELWHEIRATEWGSVSLKWIVSKTFQHTAEHTHDVMRMVLFWDGIVRREQERQEAQTQGSTH
jgi:hypothetical protein